MKRNLKSSVIPSKLWNRFKYIFIYLKLFKISTKEIEQEYIRGKKLVKFASVLCCEETEKKTEIRKILPWFSSVQFSCLVVSDSATPWTSAHQASLSITNSQSLPIPVSIESVMPSSHLILCCPLLLLPSFFPSIRVFSSESVLRIRWAKYWSFSFKISLTNEHPGLISFRMDWLDLLAVQGTLKWLYKMFYLISFYDVVLVNMLSMCRHLPFTES